MPAVIKIDPQRRIVVSSFYGEVTDAQLLAHRTSLIAEPQFNPSFAEVVDFSAAAQGSPSNETMVALARSKSLFDESVPHVIVAPEPLYAAALRFRELSKQSRPNLYVTRTIAEAYSLLEQLGFHG